MRHQALEEHSVKHRNAALAFNLLFAAFCFLACVEKAPPTLEKPCEIGDIRECDQGTNVGVCKKPRQTCLGEGVWTACSSEIKPSREICDDLDNDCDGQIDEDVKNDCGQ